MNISLTPELTDYLKQKVASGRYRSTSEVVREALRLLEESDQLKAIKLDNLRSEIQKGIDSINEYGAESISLEAMKKEVRKRRQGS